MLNEAWVLAATELAVEILQRVRRAQGLPHRLREPVEREQVEAGFLQRPRHRCTQRRPLLQARVVRRSRRESIGRVDDAVIIASQLRPRMDGTRVLEIPALVGRASLHLDGRPRLERLLEARMAVGHDEERRGQAAALQIGQQAAPRRRRFGRGQLQGQQLFLPGLRHAEGGQDRHADDAPREAHAQVKAVEEHHWVPLLGQRPLLPGREEILHAGYHARHRALREVRLAEQRLQGRADAPAVDAAEVAAQ